ncbi:MAG: zinc ribbon domain-containing protein [Solobacterium sp.]|nr:zinc ribbon domain-containing protein [Solobacterium sp.]
MENVCSKCGKPLIPGARFCTGCGSPVTVQEPKSAVQPPSSGKGKTAAGAPASPKKKSFVDTALTITLVIQLIIAGFWYPGFLRDKKKPGYEGITVLPTASPGGHNGNGNGNQDRPDVLLLGNDPDAFVMDVTEENSPGNPFLIEVDITQKELDETPVLVSAAVSPENHEVTAGSFKADFKDWNLEKEEDTWNVKALSPKEDKVTGYTLLTYDFSLASGQHEFPTCVEIHMPRTAGDYEGSVVWYNMEAGCWEPVAYSVSEDGSEYIIRTDHFSPFSELVNWFKKYTRNSYEMAGTIFDTVDTDPNGNPYPQLQKPVRMVDERVHELLAWPQESKAVLNAIKKGTIPDDMAVTNFMNMFNRFGLGYGNTVMTPITSWDQKLIDGLTKMKLTNRLVGGANVKMMKYTGVTAIQGGMIIVGIILTGTRIIYQVANGGELMDVLKANAGDLAGLTIGTAGYIVGGTTGATLGWIGLAVFLGFEAYAQAEPLLNARPMDNTERIYRHYIIKKGHALTNPVEGDTRSPDLSYGVERFRWAKALRTIFERNKNDMARIPDEVNELYDSYVNSFWNLTEQERRAYTETIDKSYRTLVYDEKTKQKVWAEWKDPEDPEVYKKHTKESIISGTQDILLSLIETYQAQAECEIKSTIQNEVLPRLNTDMVFLVRDTGLLNSDEHFDKSPLVTYAKTDPWLMQEQNHVDTEGLLEKKYPYSYTPERYDLYEPAERFLYFTDQAQSLFEPGNEKDKNVYIPPAFYPHINEDSNEVFACKYYYYMMMGNPEMLFINSDMEGNRDISPASYSIDVPAKPDVGGTINAMVVIDRNVKGQFEPQNIKFTSNDFRPDGKPVEMTFSLRSDGSFELTMPEVVVNRERTEKDMGDEIAYQKQFYKDFKCREYSQTWSEAYTLKGKLKKEDLYDDRTGWTCYGIDNSTPLKSMDSSGYRESYVSNVYDLENDRAYTVDVFRREEKTEEYTIKLSIDDHPSEDSLGYYFSTYLSISVVEENGTKKLKLTAKLKGLGSGVTTTIRESNTEAMTTDKTTRDDVTYDQSFTAEAKVPSKNFYWYNE